MEGQFVMFLGVSLKYNDLSLTIVSAHDLSSAFMVYTHTVDDGRPFMTISLFSRREMGSVCF